MTGTITRIDGLLDRIAASEYRAATITVIPKVLRELEKSREFRLTKKTTQFDGAPSYRGIPVVVGTLERGDNWSIQFEDIVLSEGAE